MVLDATSGIDVDGGSHGRSFILTRCVALTAVSGDTLLSDRYVTAFALYKRSKVIYGLFIPIVLQFASACVALIPSSLKHGAFNGQCDLVNVPIVRFTIMK